MNLNQTTTSRALVGQGLLVAGAGLSDVPILSILIGLPLVLAGAGITCEYALSIKGPQSVGGGKDGLSGFNWVKDYGGAILIVIGAVILTFGCVRSVVININQYSGSNTPWFQPDVTLLILWLIAPCLILMGVILRGAKPVVKLDLSLTIRSITFDLHSSRPVTVLPLLFLYWLAFVPLSVAACRLLRMLGFAMSA